MARRKRRMVTDKEIHWTHSVGRALWRARTKQGYGQAEFAELIDVPQPTLAKVEQGTHTLPLYPFARACAILKMSSDRLLGLRKKAKRRA